MIKYYIKAFNSSEKSYLYYVKYDKEFNELFLDGPSEYITCQAMFTEDEIKSMSKKFKWLNWKELEYIKIESWSN